MKKYVCCFLFVLTTLALTAAPYGQKKILMGILGIGNGHCSRQLPVLKHLLEEGHQVIVFTFGTGTEFFEKRFPQHENLTILTVDPIYYPGDHTGINFEETANYSQNQRNKIPTNNLAMHRVNQEFGRPDLVITDYENTSAQYSYAKRAPLVTIDQQSKYLVGDFPSDVNGITVTDEIERLSLFFPRASKRIAVSFFRVEKGDCDPDFDVQIFPPMLRPDVIAAKGTPLSEEPSLVFYMTANEFGDHPVDQWIETIQTSVPAHFSVHVFIPPKLTLPKNASKVFFYHHGDKRFDLIFFACHGVISTAGHNLLSEAMYLEKPVYALPLLFYEQQVNASIIAQGNFGISSSSFTKDELIEFCSHLDQYRENIRNDTKLLFKEPGNDYVIQEVDRILSSCQNDL